MLLTFKKRDLRTGMVVEAYNKYKYMVLLDTNAGDCLINLDGFLNLNGYDDDLREIHYSWNDEDQDASFNIMRVFEPNKMYQTIPKYWDEQTLIWERLNHNKAEAEIVKENEITEITEITLEEIAELIGVDVDSVRIIKREII